MKLTWTSLPKHLNYGAPETTTAAAAAASKSSSSSSSSQWAWRRPGPSQGGDRVSTDGQGRRNDSGLGWRAEWSARLRLVSTASVANSLSTADTPASRHLTLLTHSLLSFPAAKQTKQKLRKYRHLFWKYSGHEESLNYNYTTTNIWSLVHTSASHIIHVESNLQILRHKWDVKLQQNECGWTIDYRES